MDSEWSFSYFSFCSQVRKGVGPRASFTVDVKECTLQDWSSDMILDAFMSDKIGKALVKMPNLTKLSLLRMLITPTLLKAIRKLRNLESLSIEACTFKGVTVDHVQKLCSLKLKKLEIMSTTRIPLDLGLAMDVLFEDLEELRTDSWPFMDIVISISQNHPIPLRVLKLEPSIVPDVAFGRVCTFLRATSTITELKLLSEGFGCWSNLGSSALPNLTKVQATPYLLPLRDRPLQELHIYCWKNASDVDLRGFTPFPPKLDGRLLSVLSLLWRHLQDLELQKHFPRLETLTVSHVPLKFMPGDINFSSLSTPIEHPRLCNLNLRLQPYGPNDETGQTIFDRGIEWDLDAYHTGITGYILSKVKLPSLKRFEISDARTVRRFLLAIDSTDISYVDRNNCIKSVLEWKY
ncbi:hypothetical protein VKT23_012590 [Stygiomarasmius scandens]|uniref:Uncharacterized protein n=1 Tax=Marasmiellus scandens TaxID=2682957 RepID=A0ABR1JB04_9AGAR